MPPTYLAFRKQMIKDLKDILRDPLALILFCFISGIALYIGGSASIKSVNMKIGSVIFCYFSGIIAVGSAFVPTTVFQTKTERFIEEMQAENVYTYEYLLWLLLFVAQYLVMSSFVALKSNLPYSLYGYCLFCFPMSYLYLLKKFKDKVRPNNGYTAALYAKLFSIWGLILGFIYIA